MVETVFGGGLGDTSLTGERPLFSLDQLAICWPITFSAGVADDTDLRDSAYGRKELIDVMPERSPFLTGLSEGGNVFFFEMFVDCPALELPSMLLSFESGDGLKGDISGVPGVASRSSRLMRRARSLVAASRMDITPIRYESDRELVSMWKNYTHLRRLPRTFLWVDSYQATAQT